MSLSQIIASAFLGMVTYDVFFIMIAISELRLFRIVDKPLAPTWKIVTIAAGAGMVVSVSGLFI